MPVSQYKYRTLLEDHHNSSSMKTHAAAIYSVLTRPHRLSSERSWGRAPHTSLYDISAHEKDARGIVIQADEGREREQTILHTQDV